MTDLKPMRSPIRQVLYPILGICLVLMALVLLGLLAFASSNTDLFNHYFSLLYRVNLLMGVMLVIIIGLLLHKLLSRLYRKRFGSRLMAKLALFFALVGVLPGALIYGVSLQFLSRSIESWFDVKVETALEAGLNLGRNLIDVSLDELRNKAVMVAEQLGNESMRGSEAALTLYLSRLREQMTIDEMQIITSTGRVLITVSSKHHTFTLEPPTPHQFSLANETRGFGIVEGLSEDESGHADWRLRVILKLPITGHFSGVGLSGGFAHGANLGVKNFESHAAEQLYVQLIHKVPMGLANNAAAVQAAYREYQEKSLGRLGLRKMYLGSLTLTLFLALFIAIALALWLGNQLGRPLLMLLQGTREVAEGDLSPKRESSSRDELGFLTQQFNQMTRQLAEARSAAETGRVALAESKAYLESVLASLTAGVLVFDANFCLTTANAGAERIFRTPLADLTGQSLEALSELSAFSQAIRSSFAEPAHSVSGRQSDHFWQKQLELLLPNDHSPLTLLVRGTSLSLPIPQHPGYVVVFDDISDVIDAQRARAWGEVARRLAHEIKNPLTPIQLSAERLQMKLSGRLNDADAAILKRSTETIVNQVSAMKQMVDDFRDYARATPATFQAVNLNHLVMDVLQLYGIDDPARHEHAILRINLEDQLPFVLGDSTQLRQVIHNLVQNALDAVQDNESVGRESSKVEVKTTFSKSDPENQTSAMIRFIVADNGSGFAPGILRRAFEPYVTTKPRGTGLGLAVVKKIADEHGARVNLANRETFDPFQTGAQVELLFYRLAAELPRCT